MFIRVFLALVLSFAAQNAYGADFRNVSWGMSQAEVQRAEGRFPAERKKEGMAYRTEVLGMPTLLAYYFVQDQLVGAAYIFKVQDGKMSSEADAKKYMSQYGEIENLLEDKYGPIQGGNEIIWLNEEFKNDPDKLNEAFMRGHIKFISDWNTPNTKVKLGLASTNDKATLGAIFGSANHASLIKSGKLKDF